MGPLRNSQPNETARLPAVDGLRGLMAAVVFLFHASKMFGWTFLAQPANVAVFTFFVLSGYVLTRSWDGRFGLFLLRRFVRLWPVYALCLGAGYAIAGVAPVWSEFFWCPVLDANAKPAIDPPIWTLGVEAWAMAFMPIIALCRRPAVAASSIIGVVAATSLSSFFGFGLFFIAGAFVSGRDFRVRWLETAAPQWLGTISYSLYLTHYLVLEVGRQLGGGLGTALAAVVALPVAWIVWRWVERPSIALSRRVGAWVSAQAAPVPRAAAGGPT